MDITQQEKETYEFEIVPYHKKFYDKESDYGIYSVIANKEVPYSELIGTGAWIITLVGHMPCLSDGHYMVKASLIYNKKRGLWQYEVINIMQKIPTTLEQQRAYLESILTQRQADILLNKYPNVVGLVIEGKDNGNIDLKELKGIGKKTWGKIKNKILGTFVLSDIISMLSPLGITLKTVMKLSNVVGDLQSLKNSLTNNPYILTYIKGIGFKRIDAIAQKINPSLLDSELRAIECIKYILGDVGNNEGDTWITIPEMEEIFKELAPEAIKYIDDIIAKEIIDPHVFKIENDTIGLLDRYKKESYVYNKLNRLNQYRLEVSSDAIQSGINIANSQQEYDYDEEQLKVVHNIVNGSGVQVLTGLAGSSKSSVSRAILNIYKSAGLSIVAMAPSAKAAIRITEATGFQAGTIHKTLGATEGGSFAYNEYNTLIGDVFLIDECSMVSGALACAILRALPPRCKLILVGDSKQLPPIGWGNFFYDLIEQNGKGVSTINTLTKIYRTAENSGILFDAKDIRNNKSPLVRTTGMVIHGVNKDMIYMFEKEKSTLFDLVIDKFFDILYENDYNINNVVILVPRKEECINSTLSYNLKIQEKLIGDNPYIQIGKRKFNLGCRVMHIKNNYELGVMNGEMGTIIGVSNEGATVEYSEDKRVHYDKEDMLELDYAYAITPHKFQGSETMFVIGVIDRSHYALLDSTLLYTLITRAKKKCWLYSDDFAFNQCIRVNKSSNKRTYLSLHDQVYEDIMEGTNG